MSLTQADSASGLHPNSGPGQLEQASEPRAPGLIMPVITRFGLGWRRSTVTEPEPPAGPELIMIIVIIR